MCAMKYFSPFKLPQHPTAFVSEVRF